MSLASEMGEAEAAPDAAARDIVIVGAGMAGLYFAWRLLKFGNAPTKPKILILEMLDRVGGRLDTDIVQIDGVWVKNEEGGMRFTEDMTNLMWLIDQLGLTGDIMEFSMGDENNIYNMRMKKFTFGEADRDPRIWSEIYNLKPDEVGIPPNVLMQNVLKYILRENNDAPEPKTPEDWQRFRLTYTYRGIELYKWGFWALLMDYGLSQECLQMIEDSMGFLAFYAVNVNAGSGFQIIGYFDDLPQFKTLRLGYETLAKMLAEEITALGATISLGRRVEHFDTSTADPTLLTVTSSTQGGMRLDTSCKQLVLALPRLPLEQLKTYCPLLRDNKQFVENLPSVAIMELTKINLYFKERWWYTRYNISAGGSFTDLPMGQFYCYWPLVIGDNTGPASMTIYCDYDRTDYWDALQSMGTPFVPAPGVEQPPHSTPASTFVVEQVMRQLGLFFQADDLPAPVLSTYVRWGGDGRFGDGDHSWAVGANDAVIMEQMLNPVPGKVYVCGEAYSDEQAWVDGALRSTESLLQGHFGLAPPFGK